MLTENWQSVHQNVKSGYVYISEIRGDFLKCMFCVYMCFLVFLCGNCIGFLNKNFKFFSIFKELY